MATSPTGGFGQNSGGSLAGYVPLIGELPMVKTVIYTVPSGKNTAVASVKVYNATLNEAVVTWFINVGGVESAFGGGDIMGNTGISDPSPTNLPDGSTISMLSSVSGVTYLIPIKEYDP